MSLSSLIDDLAARLATEFNSVRSESTAALAGKQDTSAKGAANGYAGLDAATKVPIAQLPTGSTSSTVTVGNDTRLSNARTPTAHASTHASGGSDPVSPAAIGAAASSHTHTEADVTGLTADLAAKQNTSAKGAANGYASLDATGKVPAAQLPTGSSASPSTITYAATISANPTVSNSFDVTATGDITSLGVSTTGASNGQMVVIAVLASGAARNVTPAAGTLGQQLVPSGAVGYFGFRYSSLDGRFACISFKTSA